MQCPQCGTETPDDQWNCVSCRVNLYWAHKHYAELSGLRRGQGLNTKSSTPSFLIDTHRREMGERAERPGKVYDRVRVLARRAMGKGSERPR